MLKLALGKVSATERNVPNKPCEGQNSFRFILPRRTLATFPVGILPDLLGFGTGPQRLHGSPRALLTG